MTEFLMCQARVIAGFVLVLSLTAVAGCVGQLHTPYEPSYDAAAAPPPAPKADTTVFAYETVTPTQTPRRSTRRYYDTVKLEFPPLKASGSPAVQLSATYYRSRLATTQQVVIVLPIWGSYLYPSKKTTKTLLKRSKGQMHVIEVHGQEPLFYWDQLRDAPSEERFIEMATEMTGRVMDTVISIRQLVDWVEQQGEIDTDQIGLVGFSMGAIVAAIALGVDDRLNTGVLMMGAAQPGHIFATCNGYPGEVRKSIMKRFGWTQARYEGFFDDLFRNGKPVAYTRRYNPERLLILDGAFDGCMSRQARRALWEATGKPERVTFLAEHKWSFLALTPITLNVAGKRIHEFMDRTLTPADVQYACSNAAGCP